MRQIAFAALFASTLAVPAFAAAPAVPVIWGDVCRAYTQLDDVKLDAQIKNGLKQTQLPKNLYRCVSKAAFEIRHETELQCYSDLDGDAAQALWNWRIQRAMELCQPAPAETPEE